MEQARVLAKSESARVPRATVFPLVIGYLGDVEEALRKGARQAVDASRGLSIIAVRELEDAEGDAMKLRELLFQITDGLRKAAGLEYWE